MLLNCWTEEGRTGEQEVGMAASGLGEQAFRTATGRIEEQAARMAAIRAAEQVFRTAAGRPDSRQLGWRQEELRSRR
jgi:hypothetical protein